MSAQDTKTTGPIVDLENGINKEDFFLRHLYDDMIINGTTSEITLNEYVLASRQYEPEVGATSQQKQRAFSIIMWRLLPDPALCYYNANARVLNDLSKVIKDNPYIYTKRPGIIDEIHQCRGELAFSPEDIEELVNSFYATFEQCNGLFSFEIKQTGSAFHYSLVIKPEKKLYNSKTKDYTAEGKLFFSFWSHFFSSQKPERIFIYDKSECQIRCKNVKDNEGIAVLGKLK